MDVSLCTIQEKTKKKKTGNPSLREMKGKKMKKRLRA